MVIKRVTDRLMQKKRNAERSLKCRIQEMQKAQAKGTFYTSCVFCMKRLLFISYKFVKGFLAITFLLLLISS